MAVPVFDQTVIAVIWDFDYTLIPGYMQTPLFGLYPDVDEQIFWDEFRRLPAFYRASGADRVSLENLWLSHMLTYVREGRFADLNNEVLRDAGAKIEFCPGLPDFFGQLKNDIQSDAHYEQHGITLEHHIVSTGLRQMILGSAIAAHVRPDDVWGCEFAEVTAPSGIVDESTPDPGEKKLLREVVYTMDSTTKTRAIFEINKGVNRDPARIKVNSTMPYEQRRVPFENMIYVADGPSDIPVFSLLNQFGGKTYGVWPAGSRKHFHQATLLSERGRVQGLGEADYQPGKTTPLWLTAWARSIATRIAKRREEALDASVGEPPTHIEELDLDTEAPYDRPAGSGRTPDEPSG